MNQDTQSQNNAIMDEIYHTINLLYYYFFTRRARGPAPIVCREE